MCRHAQFVDDQQGGVSFQNMKAMEAREHHKIGHYSKALSTFISYSGFITSN